MLHDMNLSNLQLEMICSTPMPALWPPSPSELPFRCVPSKAMIAINSNPVNSTVLSSLMPPSSRLSLSLSRTQVRYCHLVNINLKALLSQGEGVNLGFGDESSMVSKVEDCVMESGHLGDHDFLCQYQIDRQLHNLVTMLGIDALQKLYCTGSPGDGQVSGNDSN